MSPRCGFIPSASFLLQTCRHSVAYKTYCLFFTTNTSPLCGLFYYSFLYYQNVDSLELIELIWFLFFYQNVAPLELYTFTCFFSTNMSPLCGFIPSTSFILQTCRHSVAYKTYCLFFTTNTSPLCGL
jgi:hypothetical protein